MVWLNWQSVPFKWVFSVYGIDNEIDTSDCLIYSEIYLEKLWISAIIHGHQENLADFIVDCIMFVCSVAFQVHIRHNISRFVVIFLYLFFFLKFEFKTKTYRPNKTRWIVPKWRRPLYCKMKLKLKWKLKQASLYRYIAINFKVSHCKLLVKMWSSTIEWIIHTSSDNLNHIIFIHLEYYFVVWPLSLLRCLALFLTRIFALFCIGKKTSTA